MSPGCHQRICIRAPLPSLGTRITLGSPQPCPPPAPHLSLPLSGPFCNNHHKELLNSSASPNPSWKDVPPSAARFVPQSPGTCGHTCALLSPTTTDKEQETPLELKRGKVSHQISPSEGKMGWRERDNKPQAPPWILLSKKGLQQQTHTYKEPLASWLSALASDSSALQLLAVWSPV